MKWIGQHIWDFISRFRSDVYLENIEDGTVASDKFLGLDSNNKIVRETVSAAVTDLHSVGVDGSANQILTDDGDGTITSESTFTYDGSLSFAQISSSAAGNFPYFLMTNSHAGASGPLFKFEKTADGADDNYLGTMVFNGDDDGGGALTYAKIVAQIGTAAAGDEAGKLRLEVAASDSTTSNSRQALTATGHGTSDIVDIGLGYGAASTTTIAGTLTMGSTAAMTNTGLLSVANQSNITGLGTISSGAWQGTAIVDAYVADDLTISGGTVNNSVIGGTTPAAITGTTVDAITDFTVGTTVITDDQIQFTPSTDDTVTIAAGSSGTLNITTVDDAGRNAEINITADGIISTISSASQINTTYDFHTTTFENLITVGKPSGKILRYSPSADATLTAGQVYYLRNTGSWLQADADSTSTSTVLLGLGLGGSSQTVGVMIEGFMRIPTAEILNTPTNVDGQPVYLSTTAGHLDFTAPSASNDVVRILGYAIDDHLGDVLIYFNPDRTWIEIA